MRRVLCVWLPDWPIQRWRAAQGLHRGRPVSSRVVVLFEEGGRGLVVSACSAEAAQSGVVVGMPLAEARGLWPSHARGDRPIWQPHDRAADFAALQELAGWCRRFSPTVGLEESESPEGLLLDATGVAHLFGGEEGLVAEAGRSLRRRGYAARLVLADAPGAAWALCRHGFPSSSRAASARVIPSGKHRLALLPLPLAALRLPPPTVASLAEFDVRTVEQLLALPRESLPSRFGAETLRRLDQALGDAPEPIVAWQPPPAIEAAFALEDPTADRRTLEQIVRRLLADVIAQLAERGEGARGLEAAFDASILSLRLVRPSDCAAHLDGLLRLRLERHEFAGEVARVRLRVTDSATLEARQKRLVDDEPSGDDGRFLELLDRLGSRLGPERVLQPQLVADPQPEFAVRGKPISECGARSAERGVESTFSKGRRSRRSARSSTPHSAIRAPHSGFHSSARPLFLREPVRITVWSDEDGPPLRFQWADRDERIRQALGPERIETGWWRAADVRRDYYRVETDSGRGYWLFRCRITGTWFVHGVFD